MLEDHETGLPPQDRALTPLLVIVWLKTKETGARAINALLSGIESTDWRCDSWLGFLKEVNFDPFEAEVGYCAVLVFYLRVAKRICSVPLWSALPTGTYEISSGISPHGKDREAMNRYLSVWIIIGSTCNVINRRGRSY